ncbi:hypothetical protein NL676_011840 [Syzygium grande]|nr:hypothetical protein NL676_011840 [Syzygium grande]
MFPVCLHMRRMFFVEVRWGYATARQARWTRLALLGDSGVGDLGGELRFHVSCESRAASIGSDSVVAMASLPLQPALSSSLPSPSLF